MQGRTITVALPAFNEGANLEALLKSLESTLDILERHGYQRRYVVVDDGSTDSTSSVLQDAAGRLPLTVLVHDTNQGLGPTLRDALRKAVELTSPDDVVVTMDADNTHPAPLMVRMLQRLEEGPEVVVASRYRQGSRVIGLSRHRELLSLAASVLYRIVLPIPGIRDYTCGYRVYRARILMRAFQGFGDAFIEQQGFQCIPDILLRLRQMRAVMTEVPMVLRYDRKRGHSSMKVGATIVGSLRLLLRRRFESAPTWATRSGEER